MATNGHDNCVGEACPAATVLPFDDDNVNDSASGELGCYIVAFNSQDPRLQLAQQLAAFTLNALTWLPSLDSVPLFDGNTLTAQEIIDAAEAAWCGDPLDPEDFALMQFWKNFLDAINNAGTVDFVAGAPCEIVYL